MPVIDNSWDETNPSGLQGLNLLGVRIRELKKQLRQIISTDHEMSSSGSGANWGLHNKITLYNRTDGDTLPGTANCFMLYAQDVDDKSELFFLDESDNEYQATSKGSWITGITGEIRMYSGLIANIPAGWALTDLHNRFLKGIATSVTEPGTSGGTETFSFSSGNLPTHTHTITLTANPAHNHTYEYPSIYNSYFWATGLSYISSYWQEESKTTGSSGSHTHTTTGSSFGSSGTISTIPAYCELIYIVKI